MAVLNTMANSRMSLWEKPTASVTRAAIVLRPSMMASLSLWMPSSWDMA